MIFDNISSAELELPAEMEGLEVSIASLLALAAFLASNFGASDIVTFSRKKIEHVSFTKALENWLR